MQPSSSSEVRRTPRFAPPPRRLVGFSWSAIASVIGGVAALTLAVATWLLHLLYSGASFLWLAPAFLSFPPAGAGIVFGLIAYRDIGAVASASRPMAFWGLFGSLLAAILAAVWLALFFTGDIVGPVWIEPEDYPGQSPEITAESRFSGRGKDGRL